MNITRRLRWQNAGLTWLGSALLLSAVAARPALADRDRREQRGNGPQQPQQQPQKQPAAPQRGFGGIQRNVQQPQPQPQAPHRGPGAPQPAPQPAPAAPRGGGFGAAMQQHGQSPAPPAQPHGGFAPAFGGRGPAAQPAQPRGPAAAPPAQPRGGFAPTVAPRGPAAAPPAQPHGPVAAPPQPPRGGGFGQGVQQPNHGRPAPLAGPPGHGNGPQPTHDRGRGFGPAVAPQPHFEPAHRPPPMHMGRPVTKLPPVYVQSAPPPMRVEVRPPPPSHTHVWVGGYWGWDNGNTVWMPGEWVEPPQPGYVWVQPRWHRRGHRWAYQPGYWRHRHGPVYVAAAPAGPEPGYAGGPITISGQVTTMDGAPVPGIMITLAGTQEGHIVTDNSGSYVFSGLPPGSYAIRPTGGGCAFAPDVANLNNLYGNVNQNIIVSGCPGW